MQDCTLHTVEGSVMYFSNAETMYVTSNQNDDGNRQLSTTVDFKTSRFVMFSQMLGNSDGAHAERPSWVAAIGSAARSFVSREKEPIEKMQMPAQSSTLDPTMETEKSGVVIEEVSRLHDGTLDSKMGSRMDTEGRDEHMICVHDSQQTDFTLSSLPPLPMLRPTDTPKLFAATDSELCSMPLDQIRHMLPPVHLVEIGSNRNISSSTSETPVSYTHLTLPTKA